MADRRDGILLVRDYGSDGWGQPARWRGRMAIGLDLPFWEDSCLCRAMRLHALSAGEIAAVEREADRILAGLHEALVAEGVTEEQWQFLRQGLQTRCVTPLVESVALVRHALAATGVELLAARVDVASRQWWAGQAWAAAAVRIVAAETGLPAEVVFGPACAGAVVKAMPCLAGMMRAAVMRRRGREILARLASASARQDRWPGRADVLLLASGSVVESLAARLAAKLRERGATCELARDPLAPGGATPERFLLLGSFADGEARRRAMRLAFEGPRRAGRVVGALSAVMPGPRLDAIGPRLMALECRDRPLVEWLEADARDLLDAVQPKVVVAFHFQPRLATPYLVEGRLRGAKTVWCQHGLMAVPDYESPWFDQCLVFSEYAAEIVRPKACGAEVVVVGNPALDDILQKTTRGPEAAQAGLSRQGNPLVLVATQPNDPLGSDRREDWWFAVVARACAAAGVRMWVKLHPQQSPQREGAMYRRAMAAAGAGGEIIPHGAADLATLISACDVFVSQFSTSILDALALGKPTIFVELRPGPPFYPFDDFGMAQRVTEPSQVEAALREALGHRKIPEQARQAFARRHLEPLDGAALDRMADEILSHCR